MSAYHKVRLAPDAKPSIEYVYLTEYRERHLKVSRYDLGDGEKTFSQSHWDEDAWAGGGWVSGKPDGPPIPYHLDLIHDAPADHDVHIAEGEKAADRLKALGFLATTNAGGAEKWSPALNQWFEDRKRVIIFEDNDEPGRRHARLVARNLAPIVEEIRIVSFPELPEHGDVTDWLESGHTKEELLAKIAAADIYKRPEIQVIDGNLVEIVNQAEAALLAADVGIYQRGDELVRAVQAGRHNSESDVRRAPGSTILTSVSQVWLREQMAKTAFWFEKRMIKSLPTKVHVDPPRDYPQTLLARSGEWNFRPLRAVMPTPTIARDGRIIQSPGYDPASRLLLDFNSGDFPEVPENPDLLDAQRALSIFSDSNPVDLPPEERSGLLRGFPFADGPSRSVALSAMLSSLVRVNLRTVPLHAFDAPTAGTGKSMLAEMSGLLSMGQRPPAMSQGKSAEEDEKRLSTVLHAGDPVILIDNIEEPLEGDFLCSMLTQEKVQARILGKSERRILPCTALVLATGNNLILQGDVSRRAVVCRLDAKQERPDARVFTFDAQADLMEDRPDFVVAALTALRAYALATDKPQLSPVGSFADWDLVRGTLIWCGYDDPADTRNAILAEDPKKAELIDIMALWAHEYKDTPVNVASIGQRDVHNPLRAALTNATAKEGVAMWNSKSVGWWLKRNEDKIVGGRAFRKMGEGMWKLDGAAENEPM